MNVIATLRRWSWSGPASWGDTMVMWLVVSATIAATALAIADAFGLQPELPSSPLASRALSLSLVGGLAVLLTWQRIRTARSRRRRQVAASRLAK